MFTLSDDSCWQAAVGFYFCHLKKWRPESFQQKSCKANPMRCKYAYSYMWWHNANCENSWTLKNLSDILGADVEKRGSCSCGNK